MKLQLFINSWVLAIEDLAKLKSLPGVLELEELDSVDLLDVNHGVGVTRNQTYKKQKLKSCVPQTHLQCNSMTCSKAED